ncbi:M23 family metallopeptidase [Streptomyces sp. NPDC004111]|uniref:M23 family metallopeptidase n=1 Tax=Streptomyces sp. NPDC004111 TaxID=3364690 RepID=UPI0036ADFDF2
MRRVEFMRGCALSMAACLLVAGAGSSAQADPVPEAAEVERLYREASTAVQAHEAARRAVSRARAEVDRLRAAEAAEKVRLEQLRDSMGELARSQYRVGAGSLTTTVRFLTAGSPEQLMRRMSLAGRGGHATASLLTRVRESQARLARDRAASAAVLGALKADLVRQAAARGQIERKLRLAQERLRLAEEARRAARAAARVSGTGWNASAAGAPGPSCGGGGSAEPLGPPPPADRAAAPRWVKPVDPAPLSAGFAQSGGHWKHRHTGQDFAVFDGTEVRAVGAGTVHFIGCGDGFGNQVIVRHPNGYFTQYAHLSVFGVRTGQQVAAGQTIALSGSTGNISGPHLHFEVRVTPQLGSGVDPLPWLREHGVKV